MNLIIQKSGINEKSWDDLLKKSSTASWFQSKEAYDFYQNLPQLFTPFVVAVETTELRAVCVGYITKEKNIIKQYFSRRAIIYAGPMLADDCTKDEVENLLKGVKKVIGRRSIYTEIRNFHDYSKYKESFASLGFNYIPWLNLQVDTSSQEIVEKNLSKSRKRDLRTSFRDGADIIDKPSIEQVRDWYEILKKLYETKVKTPLFPCLFFEHLYQISSAHFLLVEVKKEIIGGTCVVGNTSILYEWFVCGDESNTYGIFPSTVATYAGLNYAQEKGFKMFDMMGAGSPDVYYGVRDFKAKFGGKTVENGRYKCLNNKLLYKIGEFIINYLKNR